MPVVKMTAGTSLSFVILVGVLVVSAGGGRRGMAAIGVYNV